MTGGAMTGTNDSAGLASSLTDLMTSLAVIFILLLVVSLNDAQQGIDETRDKLVTAKQNVEETQFMLAVAEQQIEETQRQLAAAQEKTETTRQQILEAMEKALLTFAKQGVKVEADPKDPLGLLVLVPEGLLDFALKKADIPAGGREFLKAFIPQLAATACSDQFKREITSIVVEGHTDTSGSDELNLPLSQARSMAVVREILPILSAREDGERPAHGLRSCFVGFLSASGRGSVEPMRDDFGNEIPDRSRRVVFKIRVRSLEQRQFFKELTREGPSQRVWRLP
jgi:outer membrane protein OmpA-like peptidoglycan-associated protein